MNLTLPELDGMASDESHLRLLHALIAFTAPSVIVEAGTYKGHFALVAAHAAPNAVVHTADKYDHGFRSDDPRVHTHLVDFVDMLALIDDPIDFAYIDASDSESGEGAATRWRHLQAVLPKMRPGGLIVVDDTACAGWAYLDHILALAALTLPQHRGLSILCAS